MPLEYNVLGLEDARRMIDAAITYAEKNGMPPISVVVVDKVGEVIASARMDGCSPLYLKAAHRKAYSSAAFERDTSGIIDFWEGQARNGHKGPMDWNDSMVTTLPGGFCICHGNKGGPFGSYDVVGGLGVAAEEPTDEWAIAEAGLAALGEGFRHRRDWGG
jgi:glc operon protein GlcG